MEDLLRTYARKRREDAGNPPPELHPANRRQLHDEIAKIPRRPGTRISLWSWIIASRPRLAICIGVFAILAFITWNSQPDRSDTRSPMMVAYDKRDNPRSPARTPISTFADEATQTADVKLREDFRKPDAVAQNGAGLPSRSQAESGPARGVAPDTRRYREEKAFDRSAPVPQEGIPNLAKKEAATAPLENAPMDLERLKRQNDQLSVGGRFGGASDPNGGKGTQVSRSAKAANPPAGGASVSQLQRENEVLLTARQEPAATVAAAVPPPAPIAPQPQPLVPPPPLTAAPQPTPARGRPPTPGGPVALAAADTRSSLASPSIQFEARKNMLRARFMRQPETAAAKTKAQPANAVLSTFDFEQTGNEIRVIDDDGSVYSGRLLSVQDELDADAGELNGGKDKLLRSEVQERQNTFTRRLAADGSLSRANPTAVLFRVIGTNRTLGERIMFEGNFDPNLPTAERFAGGLPARSQAEGPAPAPTPTQLPSRPPTTPPPATTPAPPPGLRASDSYAYAVSNVPKPLRIVGRMRIGTSNAVTVIAVPAGK